MSEAKVRTTCLWFAMKLSSKLMAPSFSPCGSEKPDADTFPQMNANERGEHVSKAEQANERMNK